MQTSSPTRDNQPSPGSPTNEQARTITEQSKTVGDNDAINMLKKMSEHVKTQ